MIETLSSFFYCISIHEYYEEIKQVNKQRNKDVRKNLITLTKSYFDFLIFNQRQNLKQFFECFSEMIDVFY